MNENSKIYVAGHKGMVGSAIERKLRELGYNNLVLRTHKELDLTKTDEVNEFFKKECPEYVFMAAAQVGGIQANREKPADFLINNLLIETNIIEAAKKYNVKKLVFLASSCVYPKNSMQPIKEDELLTGKPEITNEGYAIAKITGIKMCEYLNRQYGLNYISVMPANSYGVNDCFDANNSHVIPALIKKFHDAKIKEESEVVMWGSGVAKREFIYVDDMADAIVFLAQNYDLPELINIGTGEEVSMSELANIIADVVGFKGSIKYDTSKPDGMLRRIVDSSKIISMGWKPKVCLREGIEMEYNYYLNTEID